MSKMTEAYRRELVESVAEQIFIRMAAAGEPVNGPTMAEAAYELAEAFAEERLRREGT